MYTTGKVIVRLHGIQVSGCGDDELKSTLGQLPRLAALVGEGEVVASGLHEVGGTWDPHHDPTDKDVPAFQLLTKNLKVLE